MRDHHRVAGSLFDSRRVSALPWAASRVIGCVLTGAVSSIAPHGSDRLGSLKRVGRRAVDAEDVNGR